MGRSRRGTPRTCASCLGLALFLRATLALPLCWCRRRRRVGDRVGGSSVGGGIGLAGLARVVALSGRVVVSRGRGRARVATIGADLFASRLVVLECRDAAVRTAACHGLARLSYRRSSLHALELL